MKYTYQDQRGGKLPRICKLLSVIYQESQSYSEIPQWAQRKKWMELDRRTSKSIWRA